MGEGDAGVFPGAFGEKNVLDGKIAAKDFCSVRPDQTRPDFLYAPLFSQWEAKAADILLQASMLSSQQPCEIGVLKFNFWIFI